ncbi:MAG: helix-turn-helix domain-containing protein [Bacteroidales bacterium]|nr:helix-turn-helix domain-containing protein [Bacteroidales bacterium]
MTFAEILNDTRWMQLIACISAIILLIILVLIRVPMTQYTRRLNIAKTTVAASFFILTFLMGLSISMHGKVADYELFSSCTMLVATSFSSLAISYAMINILDENMVWSNVFNIDGILIIVASFLLIQSAINGSSLFGVYLIINIVLFVAQSVYFIIRFDKSYKKREKELAAYYEEDEGHKIRWIRFCYVIAMLTNLVLLVYIILPRGFMRLYIAWYILYMLYFTANFVSFLSSHKIVLDAFAHRVLSFQDIIPKKAGGKPKKEEPALDVRQREKEFKKLAVNLATWVEEKRYREYEKTREQIAAELDCSKEILQLYFMTVLGKDFRNWRTELRIEDAKKMLLEDKKASPQLIAEMCGFSDRSNFHKTFVKMVGCSPKEWREKDGAPSKG